MSAATLPHEPRATLAMERWEARRRWARAGIVYVVMLLFSLLFLGPLLFAALSSLKTDPLAYPPRIAIPQLSPANWAATPPSWRISAPCRRCSPSSLCRWCWR